MRTIKLKKARVNTIITTRDDGLTIPSGTQDLSIASFAQSAPKTLVAGPTEPQKADGLTWHKTGSTVPLRHIFASFLGSYPGHEIVCLVEPAATIHRENFDKILDFAGREKAMLTWGAWFSGGFIFTSQCIAHLLNELPISMTFNDPWYPTVKEWGTKMLRHRFFDASTYGITTIPDFQRKVSEPVVAKPAKKKVVVRKVKVINGFGPIT